jgi:hypothetical protein
MSPFLRWGTNGADSVITKDWLITKMMVSTGDLQFSKGSEEEELFFDNMAHAPISPTHSVCF